MGIVLKNNAQSTLSANISSTDTTIPVADTSSFPTLGAGQYFYCTIQSTTNAYEIVKATAVNSTSLTVVRAQESTLAVPFNIGSTVQLRITVQSLYDAFLNIPGTPVNIGDSSNVDSSAPGAIGLNVTKTSTATAVDPFQFGEQIYLGIAPTTTSSTIFRGLYVRSETLTNADVSEAIGGSFYQYHSGGGLLTTQYGGTIQTRLFGSGNVTSAQGALCAARVGVGALGKYGLGRGATASAISDRTDHGIAFDNAVGLYATTRLTGDSIITDGSTVEGEILLEASGGLISTARGGYFHSTIAAGATLTTAQLLRTKFQNSGTITAGYHIFMAADAGTSPATNYALYGETTARSFLSGNLGIGDSTPSEASLVIDQTMPGGANPAGLLVRFTDDGAAGVQITYEAKSTTPAVSDVIYTQTGMGYNSSAVAKNYAFMSVSATNVTASSEAGRFNFGTFVAGTSARRFSIGGGLFDAGTTDQGIGTINCLTGYYLGDTRVIDSTRGIRFRAYTSTQIADKTNAVNTTNKQQGTTVWDSTNHRLMVANGTLDVDLWYVADGSASVTPA